MKKEIKQKLVFNGATFKKRADFKNLIFTQDAEFSNARFEDNVYFNKTEFKKEADFHESEYGRIACFYGTIFEKIPNFSSSVFFSGSKLNLINSTLSKPSYSFGDLKEKIEEKIKEKIPKPEDPNDKKEKRNLKREWLKKRDKNADDYRDSFRTLKNALLKDNNLLDAQEHHRLELYCKEIELSNAMEKTIPTDKHLESEIKGMNFNIRKFKEWIDGLHLAFYRNLCDHHTDLLKILNNLAILVALFALFALGLKEAASIIEPVNKMADLLYDVVVTQVFEFFKFKTILQENRVASRSVLYGLVLGIVLGAILFICSISKIVLEICKSQIFKEDIKNFLFKDLFLLLKLCFFCIVFLLGLGLIDVIPGLPMEKAIYIISFSSLFIILFIWLISLRSLLARYLIVLVAYAGFFYTLCNQPLFINPFIGGLFNGDKELPVIFQNPFFITLAIVYSFLMFLLLFSLQKTARKNSIVPS